MLNKRMEHVICKVRNITFPRMFRLLAFLVALNISAKSDEKPGITFVEGGNTIAAIKDIHYPKWLLNDRGSVSKDTPALHDETTFPGDERGIEATEPDPRLKSKMLGDFDDTSKKRDRMPNRGRNKKEKAKSRASKSANLSRAIVIGTSGSSLTRDEPARGTEELTIPIRSSNEVGASHPAQGSSFSGGRRSSSSRSSARPTSGLKDNTAQDEKDEAVSLVHKAQFLLSQPHADPYNDKSLGQLVSAAVYAYSKAYDRPLLCRSLVSYNINELKEILEEIKAREKRTRQDSQSFIPEQGSSSTSERPSSPSESSGVPQEVFDMMWAARAPKDEARTAVNAARDALHIRKADPSKDAATAQLIDVAIEKYNTAYDRTPLRLEQGKNKRYHLNQKLDEIEQIFDDLDERDEDLRNILARMQAYQERNNN